MTLQCLRAGRVSKNDGTLCRLCDELPMLWDEYARVETFSSTIGHSKTASDPVDALNSLIVPEETSVVERSNLPSILASNRPSFLPQTQREA